MHFSDLFSQSVLIWILTNTKPPVIKLFKILQNPQNPNTPSGSLRGERERESTWEEGEEAREVTATEGPGKEGVGVRVLAQTPWRTCHTPTVSSAGARRCFPELSYVMFESTETITPSAAAGSYLRYDFTIADSYLESTEFGRRKGRGREMEVVKGGFYRGLGFRRYMGWAFCILAQIVEHAIYIYINIIYCDGFDNPLLICNTFKPKK